MSVFLRDLQNPVLKTDNIYGVRLYPNIKPGALLLPSSSVRAKIPLRLRPDLNISFLFGVAQAGELRDCDDLRYSRTNITFAGMTHIKLVDWDHIAQLSRLVAPSGKAWNFLKAAHEADYEQIPSEWSHPRLASIALRNQKGKSRYGFCRRAMVFGDIASVLHYNVFSRIVGELDSKVFGAPVVCFFDDFGALIPGPLGRKALEISTRFCQILGISVETSKYHVGVRAVSRHRWGFALSIELNEACSPVNARKSPQVDRHLGDFSSTGPSMPQGHGKPHRQAVLFADFPFRQLCAVSASRSLPGAPREMVRTYPCILRALGYPVVDFNPS